jgi:sugar lactone lactonase YvrE
MRPNRAILRQVSRAAAPACLTAAIAASAAPRPPADELLAPPASDSSNGLSAPVGLALDPAGAVYVANVRDSTIAVFAPGASGDVAPVRRLGGPRTGLNLPPGIALDARRRIYVTNQRHYIQGEGSVTVYAPDADGNAAPIRMILGPHTRLARPIGLAVNSGGQVYVANGYDQGVVAFEAGAAGDARPRRRVPGPTAEGTSPTAIASGDDGTLLVLEAGAITAYSPTGPPIRTVLATPTDSMRDPVRVAQGPGGELYVAHRPKFRPPSVTVYAPGAAGYASPIRTIAGKRTGLLAPSGLAVGREGSLYVLNQDGRVTVYAPDADGDAAPVRLIAGPRTGLVNPTGLALDRHRRVYVTNDRFAEGGVIGAATVTVYAPDAAGDVAPIRTIAGRTTKLSRPAGIAVADDGTVYVVNTDVPSDDQGSVTVYETDAAGDAAPVRTIVGPGTGLLSPEGLVLDPADTLYVASALFRSRVTVYAPGADGEAAPVRSLEGIDTDLERPRGLALDTAGRLYIADAKSASGINAYGPDLGAVRVYRAGASGNEAPLRTITGSATRLNGPGGLAVDRAGNTYVANLWSTGPGSVTVYGPEAAGDARPLRMISGPATGLGAPTAVALDAHDTLYVANAAGTVTVYEPGAHGNVAPVRTIGRP